MELVINITEEDYNNIDLFKALKIIKNGKPLDDVLDKIRAEIDKIYEREGSSFDCLNALDELKEFIDKLHEESEEV